MSTVETTLARSGVLARGRRAVGRYGWRALCQELFLRTARPALAPSAARRLRRAATRAASVQDCVELAFEFRAYGIGLRPLQSRWEFGQLLQQVANIRPDAMLEIGTANGGSLLAFTRCCAPEAHVLSVDLPGGAFGGGYPKWKLPVYKAFAASGQRLDLVRGDSHSLETFTRVKDLLGGQQLDFLFIDGDHRYEGVRADFERYRALVRPGGLIAFHDIAAPHADSPSVNDPGDVPRFWAELAEDHATQVFIDPNGLGCFGIGLTRV